MPTNMTHIAAMRKFFGYREGQNLKDFKAELDKLTAEEKAELGQLCIEALAE